ncbi:uncharacterized protein LOC117168047 [Belonocnema kinseyi]|uniref:uncharacterized protein LOC117168047 n=1 Tax=Belonocnema kinseyi TaxID=2817044 RepID=UPI00143DFEC2|nr:uncharacterized protein LOC117168047 [Belonocnema kinseyi]
MSTSLNPPEFLQEQVERFAKVRNIANPKSEFSNASKDGDNFLGALYRVKIKGEKNGEKKELNVIFKCVPQIEELRKLLRAEIIFLNEIAFYEERFPIFVNLLKEHNIKSSDVPDYYGGSKSKGNEILILEDLKPGGFTMKETKMLDYPHALLAVRHLGRFHAYSFAIRDQKPSEFEILKKIKEPFFPEPGYYKNQLDALMDVAIKAVENEDQHYIDKVQQLKKNAQQFIDYACDGKNAEPYATLNHGDLWTNNMLFKYNKDSEPEDIRCLDYQLNRYASPALDILYMLFTCCTHEMRKQYYDELLHQYHDSLAQCLRKLGSDVQKLFPFEILLEHLQKFGGYGACMCLIDLHLITKQEDENPLPLYNVEYIQTLFSTLKTNKLYRSMVINTLKDMIDKNYI